MLEFEVSKGGVGRYDITDLWEESGGDDDFKKRLMVWETSPDEIVDIVPLDNCDIITEEGSKEEDYQVILLYPNKGSKRKPAKGTQLKVILANLWGKDKDQPKPAEETKREGVSMMDMVAEAFGPPGIHFVSMTAHNGVLYLLTSTGLFRMEPGDKVNQVKLVKLDVQVIDT